MGFPIRGPFLSEEQQREVFRLIGEMDIRDQRLYLSLLGTENRAENPYPRQNTRTIGKTTLDKAVGMTQFEQDRITDIVYNALTLLKEGRREEDGSMEDRGISQLDRLTDERFIGIKEITLSPDTYNRGDKRLKLAEEISGYIYNTMKELTESPERAVEVVAYETSVLAPVFREQVTESPLGARRLGYNDITLDYLNKVYQGEEHTPMVTQAIVNRPAWSLITTQEKTPFKKEKRRGMTLDEAKASVRGETLVLPPGHSQKRFPEDKNPNYSETRANYDAYILGLDPEARGQLGTFDDVVEGSAFQPVWDGQQAPPPEEEESWMEWIQDKLGL